MIKILKQDYDFDVRPEPYLIQILDKCFKNANNFYDFGCGRGHWAKFLIRRYQIPFNCFDVDKDAELYTKRQLSSHLLDSKTKDFSYDVIFVSFVTEMINEDEVSSSIDKIINKLDANKQKGKIFLSSSFYNPFAIKWIFYRLLGKGDLKNYFIKNKHYRNFYKKSEIISFFKKKGFKLIHSVRGEIIPKGPKYIRSFLRFIFPLEFLYDRFYLVLEFDINNSDKI